MIALLAAVPEETRLIRQSCADLEHCHHHGLDIWLGHCGETPICLAHGGIGKAAAAAAAITLILTYHPKALWLFGCGGAYPASHLSVGDLALAELEIFGDEGVETAEGFRTLVEMGLAMRETPEGPLFNAWPVGAGMTDWATPVLEAYASQNEIGFCKGAFVTVSSCSGTEERARSLAARTRVICENMEGAAVALACQQTGVSFLEIRGISNLVETRDTGRWDLQAGMVTAQKALLALLQALPDQ